MKILLSAYSMDPTKGSENSRSWNWLMTYLEKGYEVVCLTSIWGKGNIEANLPAAFQGKARIVYVELPEWLERRYAKKKGSLLVYLRYLWFQRTAWKLARKLDREHDFSLVHHVSWGSIQMGTSLWRLNKKLVFGPVGGGQFPPEGFESYFGEGWSKEIKRKRISDLLLRWYPDSKSTLRRADLVLTVNRETYQMAREMGAKNVNYFLDASVRADKFPSALPQRQERPTLQLMWVGRLMPRKALRLTLEALAMVETQLPVHLHIYGDGEQGKFVEGWIEELDLTERVTWHGQVPWDEVFAALKQNDVFIFNSLRESYGLQLIEAMACGIPIICLDLHGAGKFVPENVGIKVPVTNPEETAKALAQAVAYMYNHPEFRAQAGQAGYNYAKQQGIRQNWSALMQLFGQHGILRQVETEKV